MAKRKQTYSVKRKPTYLLKEIKKLIKEDKIIKEVGINVIESTNNMGFTPYEAYQEILNLESKDFDKSGTEPYNSKVWQDAYRTKVQGIPVYIKFKKFSDRVLLTSFKPDETQ